MKRLVALSFAMVLTLSALTGTARANSEYSPVIDVHPVRIAAYPAHMVGTVLEWLVTRPLHFVMSLPFISSVSGHQISETLITEGVDADAI